MRVNAPKGEDLVGGGDGLRTPGTYHFLITNIRAGLSVNDKPIDGFTAECKVIGGLADDKSDQANKTIALVFFSPNLAKDTAEQAAKTDKLNTAFFLSTNCIQPKQLGQDDLDIDENLANGAQFVAKMQHKQKKEVDASGNEKWVDDLSVPVKIAFSDIFHVDDPAVAKIPKNKDAIAMIEPKDRHKAEWFDFKKPKHEQGKSASKSKDYEDVLDGVV